MSELCRERPVAAVCRALGVSRSGHYASPAPARRRTPGLAGRSRGGFRPAGTDSDHGLGYAPNLLGEAGMPGGPNQAWVSDTTYVRLQDGWAYLAVTMDLHTRHVVGWSVSERNDAELAASALEKAIAAEDARWALHHSDRGSTYASARFRSCATGSSRTAFRSSLSVGIRTGVIARSLPAR